MAENKTEERKIELTPEIIEKARDNFLVYCKLVQPDLNRFVDFHYALAEFLNRLAHWEIKKGYVCLPPRTWKSTLIDTLFPAWMLGRNPKFRFAVATYWSKLSRKMSRYCKQIIKSPMHQAIFWEQNFIIDTDTERENESRGWYFATSIGWTLTGFWFDFWVVDDPFKDRQDANSMTSRENVWNWYSSVFSTRWDNENSIILIVMTRWHVDDLLWRLLQQDEENWTYEREWISVPALDENWESYRPEKFSKEFLERKRDNLTPQDWSALYQQDPYEATGWYFRWPYNYFLLSDFEKPRELEPLMQKDLIDLSIECDPAFSTSDSACDSAIVAYWIHKTSLDRPRFLFDIDKWKNAPSETIKRIFNMAEKWRMEWYVVREIGIEYVTISKAQMKFWKDAVEYQKKMGYNYRLVQRKPVKQKNERILSNLEPIFTMNQLYIAKWIGTNINNFREFETQLASFPNWKLVDIIDVVAQAEDWALARLWVTNFATIENRRDQLSNRKPKYNALTWEFY